MIVKEYKIGKYEQWLDEKGWHCTCVHGSLYPDNYNTGDKICKHLELALRTHYEEIRRTQ